MKLLTKMLRNYYNQNKVHDDVLQNEPWHDH